MSNSSSANNTATPISSNELMPSAKRDSGIELKTAIALTDSLHAYEFLKPEIDAFPKERAATINADVGTMTQNALWGVRQLEAHKEQIKREASTYDLGNIEKLRLLALALNYLQARHRLLNQANKTEAAAVLISQRDQLRKGLEFLVSRGLVAPERLSNANLTTGHHATAYDVIGFVDVLMEVSHRVSAPPYWSRSELEDIRRKADAFFDVLGDKTFGPSAHAELKLARRKVFAMLTSLWNDLYSMMQYVRRAEGDLGTIMPTLYPPRPGRKSEPSTPGAPPPAANTVDDDDDEDDGDDAVAPTNLNIAAINAAATRGPSGSAAEEVPAGFPGSRPLRPDESK